MSEPRKISVIGGAGFIGTQLCKLLHRCGTDFEIIDLRPSQKFPDRSKIADIRRRDDLAKALTGDTIVHLAAVHRDDVRDPALYVQTNADGTQNICAIAAQKSISRIVFTSTVAVYGFAPPGTDETGAINPFNAYGKTKFAGEEVLRAWHSADPSARALSILRPTVVFGEGNRGNVYNLLRQIQSGRFLMIGPGTNRKSMAYVGNVAAFLLALSDQRAGYRLYNFVDQPDLDMNTLVSVVNEKLKGQAKVGVRLPYFLGLGLGYFADAITKLTGKTLPISSIRVRKFCATTCFRSNAHALNGFTAPYSLQDGLDRTLRAEFIDPDPSREIFYTE